MAEASANGNYVKLQCNIWYDRRNDNVHVTSSDKDLPATKLHMTAKKSTQSDTNLRALLDKFGCGPASAKPATDPLSEISKLVDYLGMLTEGSVSSADLPEIGTQIKSLQKMVDALLPEVK